MLMPLHLPWVSHRPSHSAALLPAGGLEIAGSMQCTVALRHGDAHTLRKHTRLWMRYQSRGLRVAAMCKAVNGPHGKQRVAHPHRWQICNSTNQSRSARCN